jgi:hypothetical protein
MSVRNPIGTQNVFIGFNESDVAIDEAREAHKTAGTTYKGPVKDRLGGLFYPHAEKIQGLSIGSGRASVKAPDPGVTPLSFDESLQDIVKGARDTIFASTNENLISFEHSFNFDGQHNPPTIKVKLLDVDDSMVAEFLKLSVAYNLDDLQESLKSGKVKYDKRKTISKTQPDGSVIEESNPDYGKITGAEVGQNANDDWVVFKPKITPVWVAYGMGASPETWVGPMDGFVTDIKVDYDGSLVRQYEITITALPFGGKAEASLAGASHGSQVTASLDFESITDMSFQLLIELLLHEYLRAVLGPDIQILIVLPDINKYLSPVLEAMQESIRAYLKELGVDQKALGASQSKSRSGVSARRVARELRPDAWNYNGETMREVLGALGFMGGESKFPLQIASNYRMLPGITTDPLTLRGRSFEKIKQLLRERALTQTYNDIRSKNPSLSYITDAQEALGISEVHGFPGGSPTQAATHSGVDVKINTDEHRDPVKFMYTFMNNLDGLIAKYKITPTVTYENDSTLKKYWASRGIIEDASKPVYIVGDQQLISNYLYGDLAVYQELKDAIEDAMKVTGVSPTSKVTLEETLKLIEAQLTAAGDVLLPTRSNFQDELWDVVTTPAYLENVYTLLHEGSKISYLDYEGVEVPGVEGFTTMSSQVVLRAILRAVLVEFRSGYKNSNVLSLEQDISKYLLANLWRVAKSAAVKDFREKF